MSRMAPSIDPANFSEAWFHLGWEITLRHVLRNFDLDIKEVVVGAGVCPIDENGFMNATRSGMEIQELS